MSYDRRKVDFTENEHARAAKADDSAWKFADIVRETASDFHDRNGRNPRAEELGEMVGTYFLMLNRDNRWLARGKGATSNS